MSTVALGDPIPQRARTDLTMRRVRFGDQWFVHVKDPLAMRYFQLSEEEFFVLQLLDGRRSWRDLRETVAREFPQRKLEPARLRSFLLQLQEQGLTTTVGRGEGSRLLSRGERERRRQRWSAALNPLAIRLPGVNPTSWLDAIYRQVAWIFRPPVLVALCLLIGAAASLVLTEWQTVVARLPDVRAFLSATNIVWLAVSLAVVKMVHELAHGLTCRHFGAECREAGLMLLVGVPCLYCNATDAWMLPEKWQRMAIGAAGMFAELILASVATLIWWYSGPGATQALAFNVMAVSSINTLLLNGNPLLRFDGYYLLSDWLEIPNLWESAHQRLRRSALRWLLGIEVPAGRNPVDKPWIVATFGVLSLVYRVFVLGAILVAVWMFFEHRQLRPVGDVLVVVLLGSLFVTGCLAVLRRLSDPRWRRQVKIGRVILVSMVALAALSLIAGAPVSQRVTAPLVLVPSDALPVYIRQPGRLQWAAPIGQQVRTGELLVQLRDPAAELAAERTRQQLEAQELLVRQLKFLRITEPTAATELPAAEELLAAWQHQWEQEQEKLQGLSVRAPIGGSVLPPRSRPVKEADGELPAWNGTPLDPENAGCWLTAETLCCWVGREDRLEAQAFVDQGQVGLLAEGQSCRVQLEAAPATRWTATVVEVERVDVNELPPELVGAGKLAATTEGMPASATYRVRLELQTSPDRQSVRGPRLVGATGVASIQVGRLTLGQRLWRELRQVFRQPL